MGIAGTAKYFIDMGLALEKEIIIDKIISYMRDGYFYHIQEKEHVITTLCTLKESGA